MFKRRIEKITNLSFIMGTKRCEMGILCRHNKTQMCIMNGFRIRPRIHNLATRSSRPCIAKVIIALWLEGSTYNVHSDFWSWVCAVVIVVVVIVEWMLLQSNEPSPISMQFNLISGGFSKWYFLQIPPNTLRHMAGALEAHIQYLLALSIFDTYIFRIHAFAIWTYFWAHIKWNWFCHSD